MKKQIHAYYSGTVQGVGFRYTVREIADEMGVAGWAKNCADGRVEVVAEEQEEVLRIFLDKVAGHFSNYIKDTALTFGPATGEFKDFSIKF